MSSERAANPASPTPAGGAVLRDVPLQAAPVVLGRYRAAAPAIQPAASPQAAPDVVSAAALAEAEAAGFARGLREGQAQGRRDAPAEAREDGFREGYEQGLQEGGVQGRSNGEAEVLRRARQQLDDAAQRSARLDALFDAVLAGFRQQVGERLEAAHEDMVELCCAAVRQILGDEFTDRRQAVGAVRQAVTRWIATGRHGMGMGAVRVLVHPSDLELLQSDASLAEWLLQRGMQGITWEADHQVRTGGCIVSSATGDLDARFETQLASLHEIVRGSRDLDDSVAGEPARDGRTVLN